MTAPTKTMRPVTGWAVIDTDGNLLNYEGRPGLLPAYATKYAADLGAGDQTDRLVRVLITPITPKKRTPRG